MIPKRKITLEEWVVTLDALDKGKKTILFRKGGIQEEGREFRNDHYTLLNNRNRSNKVAINNWATISQVFEVTQIEQIEVLSPYYIWTTDYLRKRLNWRPRKPFYMMILKIYRLSQPKVIETIPEYSCCKSWVNLDEELFLEEAKPVLNDNNFNQIVEKIKGLFNRISKS